MNAKEGHGRIRAARATGVDQMLRDWVYRSLGVSLTSSSRLSPLGPSVKRQPVKMRSIAAWHSAMLAKRDRA